MRSSSPWWCAHSYVLASVRDLACFLFEVPCSVAREHTLSNSHLPLAERCPIALCRIPRTGRMSSQLLFLVFSLQVSENAPPCCNAPCRWLPDAQLNLAIIGVLHAAMALEDPFDNLGLDGIYIDEAVFDIEQVLLGLFRGLGRLWKPKTPVAAGRLHASLHSLTPSLHYISHMNCSALCSDLCMKR